MTLSPGFTSPAQAQRTFRAILTALSRPGEILDIAAPLEPPALSPAAGAVLLTLIDASVTVALPENQELRAWLAFHTGARFAAPQDADFVVAREPPALATLRNGTGDEPEDGATLILDVPAFGAGGRYRLSGPGIERESFVRLNVSEDFVGERAAVYELNPRGVDIIFCAGSQIIGLPRSTAMAPA